MAQPSDLFWPWSHCTNPLSTSQAWERLEKAEHERELALRTELIRQEKLEQLAARFDRKAAMRETWLSENQRLVSQVGLMFQTHPGWWGGMGDRQSQGRVPAEGKKIKHRQYLSCRKLRIWGPKACPGEKTSRQVEQMQTATA